MKKVEFEYLDFDEFQQFIATLSTKEAQKLLATIAEVEIKGLKVAQQQRWVRKLDTNLFEIRSKFSTNITRALYFQKEGIHYVITHGFKKKTQKTPIREINKAKSRSALYKKGKNNDTNR